MSRNIGTRRMFTVSPMDVEWRVRRELPSTGQLLFDFFSSYQACIIFIIKKKWIEVLGIYSWQVVMIHQKYSGFRVNYFPLKYLKENWDALSSLVTNWSLFLGLFFEIAFQVYTVHVQANHVFQLPKVGGGAGYSLLRESCCRHSLPTLHLPTVGFCFIICCKSVLLPLQSLPSGQVSTLKSCSQSLCTELEWRMDDYWAYHRRLVSCIQTHTKMKQLFPKKKDQKILNLFLLFGRD